MATFIRSTIQRLHLLYVLCRAMLEEGVYLAPSQYEAGFTSLAHTEEDVEFTIEAAKRAFKRC